jgi:serine/threonine protein kinase
VISGIVLAMQFIHSQGVVHRGLKPSNILNHERGLPRMDDVWARRLLYIGVSQIIGLATCLDMAPEMHETVNTPQP